MKTKLFNRVPKNAKMEGNSLATLNWTIISKAVIDTIETELVGLKRFSLDITGDFKNDGDTVKVELIDGVGEAVKNPTDWNTSGITTKAVDVKMDRYSKSGALTYADRKNGVQLLNKVQGMVKAVTKKFWEDVIAAMAASGAGVVKVGARADFGPAALTEVIWPSMKNGADAVYLDSMYYSKLIPQNALGLKLEDGAYNISGGIHYVEGTSALAGGKGVGFATRPDALAVAVRLPDVDPELGIKTQVVTSEQMGISVLIKTWADQGKETVYMSAELLAGVAVGNKNHLKQLSGEAATA